MGVVTVDIDVSCRSRSPGFNPGLEPPTPRKHGLRSPTVSVPRRLGDLDRDLDLDRDRDLDRSDPE